MSRPEIPKGWGKLLHDIYQAADWIVDEDHEVLLIIDPLSGYIIRRIDGGQDLTVMNDSPLTKDRVVMHNHTDEFTFSGEDVAASAEQDAWLSIVVTHHDLYFIERPLDGWGKPGVIHLNAMIEAMQRGDALNTDNAVREEAIRDLAVEANAYYWRQCGWRDNMRLFQYKDEGDFNAIELWEEGEFPMFESEGDPVE